MKEKTIYQLTKEVITEGKVKYPELAAYESFLKFNAGYYLKIEGASLTYNDFGISVIPDFYDYEKHEKLKITTFVKDRERKKSRVKLSSYECLRHQIYLHKLVKTKWEHENDKEEVVFKIEPVLKEEVALII